MNLFIAALVLVGISVFGLCFNIIFRKDGKFPETDVGGNREMRKRGIRCARYDEMKLWSKKPERVPLSCGDADCDESHDCDAHVVKEE